MAATEDNTELNLIDSDEEKEVMIKAEDEHEDVEMFGSPNPVKTKEKDKIKPVIINGAENTVFRTKELVLKVEYNGDIRKKILPNSEITYDELLRQIGRIFKCETLSLNDKLCVKYKDEDGDMVRFDTDEELQVAVLSGKILNLKVETSTEGNKISSSEISKELLEMKKSIETLLAKLDKSQVDISPVPKENSTSQNLASSFTPKQLSDISKYVPSPKLNNIVVQPKENTSVLGNPSLVAATPPQEPEKKLNQYPTNENENSGNMFPNGQSASVNSHFIPQAPSMMSVPSPMHVSSASASGIFQQPGPGPVTTGAKNLPTMGNFGTEYARPTNSLPSATITSTNTQVHPTAHQLYQPVHGNPINTYGVPFNPTSVQPTSTPLNNYFTPTPPTAQAQNVSGYQAAPPTAQAQNATGYQAAPPTAQTQNVSGYQAAPPTAQTQNVSGYQAAPPTAQTQNVSGYQAAPPMIRAPVAQAPPPLPNINHPGSLNPYARSTAPPRFGMQ